MVNTTAKGNAYRDSVAKVLTLANYDNVQVEVRISHKNVDIYFERHDLTCVRKVAVECKDYSSSLSRDRLIKIYADYNPLIESNSVDEVWIIAPISLQLASRQYIESLKNFRFITHIELENTIIDFGKYVLGISKRFFENSLNEYFIEPSVTGGKNLYELIYQWSQTEDKKPIAVLGGYGTGKSSFSKYLAHRLADSYSKDSSSRLPILITLGDIAQEQSLEGLLSKCFTYLTPARGFDVHLFKELNRRGKFIVILDGFDEMKHTMSWEQFKYNFSELNKLIDGKSKVVLLGRPSAFLSEEEKMLVLKGINLKNEKQIRNYDWPEYDLLELDYFSVEQAYSFIELYMRHLMNKSSFDIEDKDLFLKKRISEIKEIGFTELIPRPVQAKMLAEIAVDPNVELRDYSRFELYDLFIENLISREHEKSTRLKVESSIRADFIRRVAWWLWTEKSSQSFNINELPDTLFDNLLPNTFEFSVSEIKREFIVGSILESKEGGDFYFSHRSFQEFLIASYLSEKSSLNSDEIPLICSKSNPEILRFLIDTHTKTPFFRMVEMNLPKIHGVLRFQFLHSIHRGLEGDFKSDILPSDDPWTLVVRFLKDYAVGSDYEHHDDTVKYAEKYEKSHSLFKLKETKLMNLCLLLILAKSRSKYASEASDQVYLKVIGIIFVEALDDITKIVEQYSQQSKVNKKSKIAVNFSNNIFLKAVCSCVYLEENGRLKVSLSGISSLIVNQLKPRWGLEEFSKLTELSNYNTTISSLSKLNKQLSLTNKGGKVSKFLVDIKNEAVEVIEKEKKPVTTYPKAMPEWARTYKE